MKEITVLKVAPMCVPEVVVLKNGLRFLQEAVSIDAPSVGLIEIINLDSKTAILCNEEGKIVMDAQTSLDSAYHYESPDGFGYYELNFMDDGAYESPNFGGFPVGNRILVPAAK